MSDIQVLELGVGRFGLVNVPRAVYKYFDDADHAHNFFTRGVLRIGTLHDFRRIETHVDARGDAEEGHFEYGHESESPELITLENAPPPIRQLIQQTGIPIASNGGVLSARGEHPDCYLFCISASAHAAAVDYGSQCVRIDDVPNFFAALTRHMYAVCQLLTEPHGFAAPCIYRERKRVSSSIADFQELPMAFIKPPTRASDEEVRAVWHPDGHPIKPFVTECGELTPFLSRPAV